MSKHQDICEALLGYPLDRVVVLDTETTGLNSGYDELLSIAIVDGHGKTLFDSYVRPTRHHSWPDAQKVNHISPLMVMTAPTIAQLRPKIAQFFSKDTLVVGYNVRFDLGFLNSADVFTWDNMNTPFDVMREYARVHGSQRWDSGSYRYSKLTQCALHYGYAFNAHDALEDARATSYCFRALLCDDAYVQKLIDVRRSDLSDLRTTQTNATKSNIADFLGSLSSTTKQGTLGVGEVTRGKNKGMKRFECMLDGKCVGIVTKAATDRILKSLAIDSPGELDTTVLVTLALRLRESSYTCSFTVEPSILIDEIARLSKRDDPRNSFPMNAKESIKSIAADKLSQPPITDSIPQCQVVTSSTMKDEVQSNTMSESGNSAKGMFFGALLVSIFLVMLVPGVGVVAMVLLAVVAYFVLQSQRQ